MHRHSVVPLLMLAGLATTATAQMTGARVSVDRPNRRDDLPPNAAAFAHQGMWFSVGLGAGDASLHCQICQGEQQTRGTTGYVRLGTTLSPTFLVGAEANGWMRSDQAGKQRVVALTGNAYWYPNPKHGLYVKGGFGVTSYRQSLTDDNDDEITERLNAGGFTIQVGTGYEVRVNPKMSIVPYLNLLGSAHGTLSADRDDGTRLERNRLTNDVNVVLIQVGMGITWH